MAAGLAAFFTGVTEPIEFAFMFVAPALYFVHNVVSVDNCITRLRVEVKDMNIVNQDKIKATGIPGINIVKKNSIQVIVGTQVQFAADEIAKVRK